MEIDDIFQYRTFSPKTSACAKILAEWKTAFKLRLSQAKNST